MQLTDGDKNKIHESVLKIFDVYYDSKNVSNQYGEFSVGDGLFVFPGTDRIVSKRSPELNGPVAGLRFFNWRQGFIDYEYLALAAQKDPQAVAAIVKPIISGTRMSSGLPGEKRTAGYPVGDKDYSKAREALAKIIMGDNE